MLMGGIMRIMKAISLFSGAGGMDIGVKKAGFTNICAIEKDEHCIATLRANTPVKANKMIIQDDIRAISPISLMRSLGMKKGDLSLLYGGPPCQPFSPIGKRLGLEDERGDLIFQMSRFAKAFRPDVLMMEQVPGVWTADNGGIISCLIDELRKIGFAGFSLGILNAADFGVAQNRKRFIFIASRLGFALPCRVSKSRLSIGQVIGDLPAPVKRGDKSPNIENHIDVTPRRDIERISSVPEGEWLGKQYDAPKSIRVGLTRKDSTKFRRLARNLPSNTLRCGEIFYHPLESRYLTPREYMRIHGFKDSYVLQGPVRGRSGTVRNLDQHRQVANSVPPPLAQAVAKNIMRLLRCQ